MEPAKITVKGAREHNLQDVSLTLPRGRLICFTGISGSGKSSFAFDTLFAEGQRRYLESLSSYARQFLGQLAKPDVDHITGLSPAICIQQKTSGWNPRSTVGTITQIQDYLRVLFARVGRQHCTQCSRPISAQTREKIIARILELPEGAKVLVLAPVVRGQKGEYRDLFEDLMKQGYARARVDGEVVALSDAPSLTRQIRHNIEVVVDRLSISPTARPRLAEAVESALKLGEGTLIVQTVSSNGAAGLSPRGRSKAKRASNRKQSSVSKDADLLLSSHYACTQCGISFEPPSPQLFSFNSPTGMCLTCDGMGTTFDFDPDLLIPNPRKSFFKLAVEPMRTRIGRWRRHIFRGVAKHVGFDINAPWYKLPKKAKDALLFGLGDAHVTYEWRWSGGVWRHGGKFEGVIANLRDKHRKAKSNFVRAYYEKYMRKQQCPDCHGGRLNAQATAVRIGGANLNDVCALSIRQAGEFFEKLKLTPTEQLIAEDVIKEIRGRLRFLSDVGLDYLTLDRTAPTLAGGESQRIRLASQIGAGLVGVLYILDEPSIGLHARDNQRLLDSLCRLRDLGNTVIVVEHDEQTMRVADEIVDFGPGPGVRGGKIVARGSIEKIAASKRSITGRYLRGDEEIEVPQNRRPVTKLRANNKANSRPKAKTEASPNGKQKRNTKRRAGSARRMAEGKRL
ncbi:MAG: excinuclease ABC subunit UvrA [Phycisphaerales bacterium]|nr:MAG: excinuclease ABC subunit UvrA [Phycisphaerales bacterium]